MGKKISILFSITVIFTLLTFSVKTFKVEAIDNLDIANSNDLTKYSSYLNSISDVDMNLTQYYKDMERVAKNYYSNFNVTYDNFEKRVTGANSYKILEITPDSYNFGVTPTTVSKLMSNVDSIKDLYKGRDKEGKFTNRYVFTNMQNFEVKMMTIKEFVASRETISGVYDAIVFTGSNNYNPGEQLSCTFNVDVSQLIFDTLYDGKEGKENKKIYSGYLLNGTYHGTGTEYDKGNIIYDGQFKDGLYHGEGTLYDGKGNKVYSGGWIDGKRACSGTSYKSNTVKEYSGKWLNDKYHGYGTLYNSNGTINYEGYWHEGIAQKDLTAKVLLNDITELKANEIIENFVKKGLPVFIHDSVYTYQDSNFNKLFKNLNTQYPNNVFKLKNETFSVLETVAIMNITEMLSTKPNLTFSVKPVDYYSSNPVTYNRGESLNFKFTLTGKPEASMIFYVDLNQNNVFEQNEIGGSAQLVNTTNGIEFTYKIPNNIMSGLLKYRIDVTADNLVSSYEGTVRVKGDKKIINVVNIVSEVVYNSDLLLDETFKKKYFVDNGDYEIRIQKCKISDIGNNGNGNSCSHSLLFDPNNNNIDLILLGQDIFNKNLNTPTYTSIQEYINSGKPLIFTSSITKGSDKWQKYFSDDLLLSSYRTDSYIINNANRLQIMNKNSFNSYPNNIVNDKSELIIPEDLNYAFNENFQLDLEKVDMVPLLNMYKKDPYTLDRFDAYNNFYYVQAKNVVYLNIGSNSNSVYKEIEHKLLANAMINLYIYRNAKAENQPDYYQINMQNSFNNALINVNDPVNFSFSLITNIVKDTTYNYKLKVNSQLAEEGPIIPGSSKTITLNNVVKPNLNKVEEVYVSLEVFNHLGSKVKDYSFKVYVADIQNYFTVKQTLNAIDTKIIDKQIGVNKLYNLDYTIDYQPIDLSIFNNSNLPSQIKLTNIKFKEILPANVNFYKTDSSFNEVPINGNEKEITKTLNDLTLIYSNGKYLPSRTTELVRLPISVTNVGSYMINKGSLSVNGISTDYDQLSLGNVDFNAVYVLNSEHISYKKDYIFIPFQKNTSNYVYLPELFTVNKDVKVSSTTYTLTENDTRFVFNDTYNTIEAKSVGTAKLKVVIKDIFGSTVTKEYTVISYEPFKPLDTFNLTVNVNQNPVLLIKGQQKLDFAESLTYTIQSVGTDDQIIEIVFIDGYYYVKPLKVGSANVTINVYDYQGNIDTKTINVIVKEPSAIEFTEDYIPLFINGSFDLKTIVNQIKLKEFSVNFNDITWTSSDHTIATITDGIISSKSKSGFAIITGTITKDGKVHTSQILVKVSEYISKDSGFDRTKLENRNLYDNYPYDLMNFVKNLGYENVKYNFNAEVTKGNGSVTIDEFNKLLVNISEFDSIEVKLTVKITQTITNGDPIIINDTIYITIYGGRGNF